MNRTIKQMASDIFDEALKQGLKLEALHFSSTPYSSGGHRLIQISAEIEITHPTKTKFEDIIVGPDKEAM